MINSTTEATTPADDGGASDDDGRGTSGHVVRVSSSLIGHNVTLRCTAVNVIGSTSHRHVTAMMTSHHHPA